MMTLIVGKPGAGKSLLLVKEHIIPAASGVEEIRSRAGIGGRAGVAPRHVITNVPLVVMRIEANYPAARGFVHYVETIDGDLRPFADPDKLLAWSEAYTNSDGVGPLFVIDEAHMTFARGKVSQALLEWLTLHRHHAVDIVLATQQVGQLDRNVAGLAELYVVIKRNRQIGFGANKYRRWDYDGYPKGAIINFYKSIKHDPRFFKYYRSRFSEALSEAEGKSRPLLLTGPFLLIYPLAIFVVVFGVGWGLPSFQRTFGASEVVVKPEPDKGTLVGVPVLAPGPALPPPPAQVATSAATPVSNPLAVPKSAFTVPEISGPFGDLAAGLVGVPVAGPTPMLEQAPGWRIHGWIAFVKDGEWKCEARFTDSMGDQVKPWAMKARLKWKSIETEWDPDEELCTLTIDEGIEGREPFIDVAQVGG